MKPAEQWPVVSAQLTGLRLAIVDELLSKGSMDYATLSRHLGSEPAIEPLTEAIAWLARHRLLVNQDGTWRAVHPSLARMQFEMNGPAYPPGTTETTTPTAEPAARGQTAAVHKHQVEFFTAAGYRDSLGSNL